MNYTITYDPPPIPLRQFDYLWAHIDYDGPEDPRCGRAASPEACMEAIKELEDAPLSHPPSSL